MRDLSALEHLVLSDTLITDAGLVHLEGLTALTYLGLHNTAVTAAGVARLQLALPRRSIAAGPW